jgi:plasmid maintenance system antidote protein VapI
MERSIEKSVGVNGHNNVADVITIQEMLDDVTPAGWTNRFGNVTADTALPLPRLLKTSPQLWMRLQADSASP